MEIKREMGEWRPGEDVVKLCAIFTNFLMSPENFAHYAKKESPDSSFDIKNLK
jgi:hypothetical protein